MKGAHRWGGGAFPPAFPRPAPFRVDRLPQVARAPSRRWNVMDFEHPGIRVLESGAPGYCDRSHFLITCTSKGTSEPGTNGRGRTRKRLNVVVRSDLTVVGPLRGQFRAVEEARRGKAHHHRIGRGDLPECVKSQVEGMLFRGTGFDKASEASAVDVTGCSPCLAKEGVETHACRVHGW